MMLPIERLAEVEVSLELITALRGYIIWFPILGNSSAAALPGTMSQKRWGDIQMTVSSKRWYRMACFLVQSGVSSSLIANRIIGKRERRIHGLLE
jgi:hypothetical protein